MPPAPHTCVTTCGQSHEAIDFSFAADFPDPYANLSADARDTRAILVTDHCIIDQKTFFLCGCLEIPISNSCHPERGAFSFAESKDLGVPREVTAFFAGT
jgi:hypothetical protein